VAILKWHELVALWISPAHLQHTSSSVAIVTLMATLLDA
jgi:hypothetical protein